MDNLAIMCDAIIEETAPKILMKRKQPVKRKMSIFHLHFINYYSIIDSC